MVRRRLASKSSGPWLLTVDNIDDARLVQRAWDSDEAPQHGFDSLQYLPHRARSAVWIACRDRHAAFTLTNYEERVLSVEVMDSKEAAILLDRKLANHRGDQADKNRLATRLEYIPLAMTQAAGYIGRRQ